MLFRSYIPAGTRITAGDGIYFETDDYAEVTAGETYVDIDCTFQTGKRYNCDLSASYNIGARYFIRELLKPLPATERSLLEAKVPPLKRRTSCVYADLRKLHSEMERLKAAKIQADIQRTTCNVGTCHIWHGKKRISAQT